MAQPVSAFAELLRNQAKTCERPAQPKAEARPSAPKTKAAETAPDAPFLHLLKGAQGRPAALPSNSKPQAPADASLASPKAGTAGFLIEAGRLRRGEAKAAANDRPGAPKPGTAALLLAAGRLRRGEAP